MLQLDGGRRLCRLKRYIIFLLKGQNWKASLDTEGAVDVNILKTIFAWETFVLLMLPA